MNGGLFTLPCASLDGFSAPATGSRCARPNSEIPFVTGDENAVVRVLAAAAANEESAYNPIVLYGAMGVGKSSVAHSLAALRQNALGLDNVLATTGSELARTLAHAIDADAVDEFRSRYHSCKLLLIDDLHRLAAKPAAQQFLLTTLDVLLRRGVLIIATMRRAPQATRGIRPKLASRLSAGLVVRLSPPGFDARYELVKRTAARHAVRLTDQDIHQIADGRGGLSERLLTADKLKHAVLERAAGIEAREATNIVVKDSDDRCKLICRTASAVVSKHYGVPAAELKRSTRRKTVAEARALAMYLVRALATPSYSSIGKCFGGRDHTTVMHACRKLTATIEHDVALRRTVDDLAMQIAVQCDL